MVYTENDTYTAVRRRASHHCTRYPAEAMPLPNWGVLSAAVCIISRTCILQYKENVLNYMGRDDRRQYSELLL